MKLSEKKILIIRLSSLGDVLLSSPLVRALSESCPESKIDFLVREEYKDVYSFNPRINSLLTLRRDNNEAEIQNHIKCEKYDIIIDLQNNLRSLRLVCGSGKKVYRFKKNSLRKFLFVKLKINLLKESDCIPERYADSMSWVKLDGKGLEIFLNPEKKARIENYGKIIGICPGARHFTKMWPIEYYIELINKLNDSKYKVALIGGKTDKEICENISLKTKNVINLSGEDDLLQIAADIKNCELVICNDSGMMHLTSAVGSPLIAIFGSTVREFGFFPYKNMAKVIETEHLKCRPCTHIGRNKCPRKHFDCMRSITPEIIFNSIMDYIQKA